MATATLVAENLSQFCPTTNFYSTDDGRHLLVTVPRFDIPASVEAVTGIALPISMSHLPTHADVFLADENAVVVDADGDPTNGMTALLRVEDCDTFEAALTAAGFEIDETAPTEGT